MKQALGDTAKAEGETDNTSEAFDVAHAVMRECRKKIIEAAEPFAERNDFISASVVVFTVVWALVGWAIGGVRQSEEEAKRRGESVGPVKKMWDIISIGFMAKDPEETEAKLAEYMRENGYE